MDIALTGSGVADMDISLEDFSWAHNDTLFPVQAPNSKLLQSMWCNMFVLFAVPWSNAMLGKARRS